MISAKAGLFMAISCALSGCASVDTVNTAIKQLSGGVLSVGTASADDGSAVLSKGIPLATHKTEQVYRVPVDVDTAAARIKRYYHFMSGDEVAQLRSNGTQSGGWTAASVTDGAWAWDAQPGSYYKMGRDWGSENTSDSILIEIEKNGSGSSMTITFRSGLASHATPAYVGSLFGNIKAVAEGSLH